MRHLLVIGPSELETKLSARLLSSPSEEMRYQAKLIMSPKPPQLNRSTLQFDLTEDCFEGEFSSISGVTKELSHAGG
jgi:hypothetical protein